MLEYRFAVGTLAATFLLLILGGLVSGTGSSLACPDWPTCYGSFAPAMTGGVEYEHTHRVVATMVGVLTLALAALLWRRREEDRPLFRLGLAAVFLVVFQGVLGGITVLLGLPTAISAMHLATAMGFFSLLAVIVLRARRLGQAEQRAEVPDAVVRYAGFAALVVYAQVALGGLVRHTGAGLACPDFPLCNGAVWPVGQHPAAPVHMIHRYLAVVVAAVVLVGIVRAWRVSHPGSVVRRLAGASGFILVFQIALGITSVLTHLDLVPVTAHLGGGAALLCTSVSLWVAARHGLVDSPTPVPMLRPATQGS